MSRQNQY